MVPQRLVYLIAAAISQRVLGKSFLYYHKGSLVDGLILPLVRAYIITKGLIKNGPW